MTPFIVIAIGLTVILAAFLVLMFATIDYTEGAVCGLILGGFVTMGGLVASFSGDSRKAPHIYTETPRIEITPYRVIVTAFGQETVFTDAYTVANASRLDKAQKTIPLDSWGNETPTEAKVKILYREEAK